MFEECSAPMSAHESSTESIALGREMGGDEGKDIHWDAVDGCERVPPFADGCQCGRSVPVELGNGIQGEAAEEVKIVPRQSLSTHDGE